MLYKKVKNLEEIFNAYTKRLKELKEKNNSKTYERKYINTRNSFQKIVFNFLKQNYKDVTKESVENLFEKWNHSEFFHQGNSYEKISDWLLIKDIQYYCKEYLKKKTNSNILQTLLRKNISEKL